MTERIYDCAGCGKPIAGEHVVKGIFAYHRDCALRGAPDSDADAGVDARNDDAFEADVERSEHELRRRERE
jgi:hypothetical protein